MKVLYVCLKYAPGTDFINETIDKGFIPALELFSKLSIFYYDHCINDEIQLSNALYGAIDNVKPDIILFDTYLDTFDKALLNRLKSSHITAAWFGDDQWRFDDFSSKYANCYTFIITTDKYAIHKYNKLGQNNVILSNWGAIYSPETNILDCNYERDLIFVGSIHPYRKWFVNRLEKLGYNIDAFGPGWNSDKITMTEMQSIYSKTKICLNVNNTVSYDCRHLSIKNPRSFSTMLRSKKIINGVNQRLVEIPYYGGFQLTEYGTPIEDYFDIGKEIACFKTIDDAEMLIQYYLENEDEREKIRSSGYIRARESYDYKIIIGKFIKEIYDRIKTHNS